MHERALVSIILAAGCLSVNPRVDVRFAIRLPGGETPSLPAARGSNAQSRRRRKRREKPTEISEANRASGGLTLSQLRTIGSPSLRARKSRVTRNLCVNCPKYHPRPRRGNTARGACARGAAGTFCIRISAG